MDMFEICIINKNVYCTQQTKTYVVRNVQVRIDLRLHDLETGPGAQLVQLQIIMVGRTDISIKKQ